MAKELPTHINLAEAATFANITKWWDANGSYCIQSDGPAVGNLARAYIALQKIVDQVIEANAQLAADHPSQNRGSAPETGETGENAPF